jgi:hypothetical protein
VTVYVDDMRLRARVGRLDARWSHMLADSEGELVEFARRLGLRPDWIQHAGDPALVHFDVTDTKRREALRLGAVSISWREAGLRTRAIRRGLDPAAWRPETVDGLRADSALFDEATG